MKKILILNRKIDDCVTELIELDVSDFVKFIEINFNKVEKDRTYKRIYVRTYLDYLFVVSYLTKFINFDLIIENTDGVSKIVEAQDFYINYQKELITYGQHSDLFKKLIKEGANCAFEFTEKKD